MAANENVKIAVKGTALTLTIDLKKNLGESASGKSDLIAKCRETVGEDVTIQLTVYRKRK